jgi:hypothetical protein
VIAAPSNVDINITMPFDTWYALNKNRIKYYSPPTTSDEKNLQSPLRVDSEIIKEIK